MMKLAGRLVSWLGGSTPALLSAWTATIGVLWLWLSTTPEMMLRQHLQAVQFWTLEVCISLGAVLAVISLREMLRAYSRASLLQMVGIALLAAGLSCVVAPRTGRIFYDEQIYQGIGQNLADLRRAQMCNDGTVEYGRLQCVGGEYNKQPYAYPHLLSLGYRLVGVTESVAAVVNTTATALSACAVYLLVLLVFGDTVAAFLAALVLALTPMQVVWSATAAVEPTASLAALLAVLATAWFCRTRRTMALAGLVVAAAWAVQFRPESALIVPVMLLMLWQGAREEFGQRRLWWAALGGLVLVAVHIAHLFAVRNEGWGTSEARLALEYVRPNLRANGGFFVNDGRFPALYTLLAAVGLVTTGRRGLPFALYFAVFLGITLLFYAGSYDYGADVRYALLTFPPIAVLAGLGGSAVSRGLAAATGRSEPRAWAVAAALGFQFLWYAPLVRATTEEAWAARADVRFAAAIAPSLRGNTYVLTHNPSMFHLWGVNAGQMSLVAGNPSYLDYLAVRYRGGVFIHWNFWCNVSVPAQQEMCRTALAARPSETAHFYQERDYTYAFYRVVAPAPVNPPPP